MHTPSEQSPLAGYGGQAISSSRGHFFRRTTMKIKAICVNCEVAQDEDGTFALEIAITGLNREHVQELADALKEPVRAVITAVIGDGGRIPVEHIDAGGPVQ